MKSIPKAKGTAGTLAVVLSLLTLGLSGPIAPPASAGSIDKTFEIGPGTQFARSNHRTFAVPSGLTVSAKVDFYRLGDPGTANDIPIIIELRQPGANAEQDGPIVQQVSATARRTSVTPGGDGDTVTLTGAASSSGCGNPWRVR
ncbi:MAG: hypothetical protein ACRD68_01985, partial [Pyrinomonadaceae bacterium]